MRKKYCQELLPPLKLWGATKYGLEHQLHLFLSNFLHYILVTKWQPRPSNESELYQTFNAVAWKAIELDVAITIDAEEADRLELSLELFEKVSRSELVKAGAKNWSW